MPNFTVFIRNADVEKWKALPNKSEAISQLLNGGVTLETLKESKRVDELIHGTTPSITEKKESVTPVLPRSKEVIGICPHGNPIGQCSRICNSMMKG